MCGISLVVGAPAASAGGAVERMIQALAHRGPDARDVLQGPACVFGHTRLSVIDLDTGAQPMRDESGRYAIVFNGEIYNYRSLRCELMKEGVRFRTEADTEVVLAAYLRWGVAALNRFRGMFAFAVWDGVERTLFLARDLFGEKPLYLAELPGGLVAASEIKALVRSGLVPADLNLEAVDAYLAFGYVPPAMAIYRGIRPLPPGHLAWWRDGRLTIERYWAPAFVPRDRPLGAAVEELQTLLARAVERQMVSDVPLGAFLSGGLDSSTIVALMHRHSAGPVKTFSVGFGEEINELPYAAVVAKEYGTEHHEVDLGTPPVADLLERMASVYDEPFADSSSIPTYLLAGFARQHVKVVLSGDGGDELFGGYGWYPLLALSERLRGTLLEWVVLRTASRLLRERVALLHRRSVAVGLAARWPEMWSRALNNQVYLSSRHRASLWARAGDGMGLPRAVANGAPADSVTGLNRAFHFDLTTYLPGDILVKVDRASMAHGLEVRVPFLDRDLAEFALSLPPSFKADTTRTKILLRHACEPYWPEAVRRRGKHGFGAPYRRWLRRPDVRELTGHVFRASGPLRDLLPGTPRSPSPDSYATWILLTLGLWLDRRARP
jgi:asparagine synthase (glutamine-hydrolysing)